MDEVVELEMDAAAELAEDAASEEGSDVKAVADAELVEGAASEEDLDEKEAEDAASVEGSGATAAEMDAKVPATVTSVEVELGVHHRLLPEVSWLLCNSVLVHSFQFARWRHEREHSKCSSRSC